MNMIAIIAFWAASTAFLRFRFACMTNTLTLPVLGRQYFRHKMLRLLSYSDRIVGFCRGKFSQWLRQQDAVAAVESALIFPVMLVMLLGTFDTGFGILTAQKTIRATQVTADLIARNRAVSDRDVDEAIQAGMLALTPNDTTSFGVDIQSFEFDEDGAAVSLWCETRNMARNSLGSSELGALAVPGEGVVVVTVRYDYEPTFSGFLFDTIALQEVSFVRGRLTSSVTHETGSSC